MKMNPVVHFEMPAKDKKRVADFYSTAFGWNMKQFGEEMGDYLLAQTTETDENGMVKRPGAINGGFWQSENNEPPHVVIAVEDIHESIKLVTAAGGTVVGGSQGEGKPDDIPGVGLYASFIDTEGNRVGMLQANPRQ